MSKYNIIKICFLIAMSFIGLRSIVISINEENSFIINHLTIESFFPPIMELIIMISFLIISIYFIQTIEQKKFSFALLIKKIIDYILFSVEVLVGIYISLILFSHFTNSFSEKIIYLLSEAIMVLTIYIIINYLRQKLK